jgi:hypothetical protein
MEGFFFDFGLPPPKSSLPAAMPSPRHDLREWQPRRGFVDVSAPRDGPGVSAAAAAALLGVAAAMPLPVLPPAASAPANDVTTWRTALLGRTPQYAFLNVPAGARDAPPADSGHPACMDTPHEQRLPPLAVLSASASTAAFGSTAAADDAGDALGSSGAHSALPSPNCTPVTDWVAPPLSPALCHFVTSGACSPAQVASEANLELWWQGQEMEVSASLDCSVTLDGSLDLA